MKMSDEEDGPKQAKIPRVLKPKDRENKRLIVILERASLETVKVYTQPECPRKSIRLWFDLF